MFTDADHAKAVELYKRFGTAEWWPKVNYNAPHDQWTTDFKIEFQLDLRMAQHHALSAIAWAMVERLGDIDLYHDPDRGYFEYSVGVVGPTRFLALAAAIENTNKEA